MSRKNLKKCIENNYVLVVTSDHGNADLMFNTDESIKCTTHSINPVPFIVCGDYKYKKKKRYLGGYCSNNFENIKP